MGKTIKPDEIEYHNEAWVDNLVNNFNDVCERFDVCKRGILKHKFKIKELREKKKNSFGYRIAKVMDDLKSSHCFFIIQMAYKDIYGEGGMAWEEAQIKIDKELEREGK